MQEIKLLEWTLEIDKNATREIYKSLAIPTKNCDCSYCRNFAAAGGSLEPDLVQILDALSIDPSKPAEVYEINKCDDGTYFYGGWYHAVGKIISGRDGFKNNSFQMTGKFQVMFRSEVNLVPENFPRPVLQVDFYTYLPWLIEEKSDEMSGPS